MVVALLVMGIPLWPIFGFLLAVLLNRRRIRRLPGAFLCKVRLQSGTFPGLAPTYSRDSAFAMWVHDVLVVFHGRARAKLHLLPTRSVQGATRPEMSVKGLGEHPQSLTLLLGSGAMVAVVAPDPARPVLVGPYQVGHSAPVGLLGQHGASPDA